MSIGDGAVALHNETGVPLRSLGTGSARLLIAGLQREAFGGQSGIVLVDEVETGLEPRRLQRLLMSLGAKEAAEPLQVFLTTHSPIAVRELNAKQLWVVHHEAGQHAVHWAGQHDEMQGTARATPKALLAKTIILCEGASEVGLGCWAMSPTRVDGSNNKASSRALLKTSSVRGSLRPRQASSNT